MANKLIGDLTLRSDFDETCQIPVDDGIQTWRTTGQQIYDFIQRTYSAKSADYVILDDDGIEVVNMTTSSSDKTVTLPDAVDNPHRILTIKKADSGSGIVTVARAGSDTIDGATSFILKAQYDAIRLISTSGGWAILGLYSNRIYTGTWTPAVKLDSTSQTLGASYANYQVVGNVCHFTLWYRLSATSGTGSLNVSLPFTAKTVSNGLWVCHGSQQHHADDKSYLAIGFISSAGTTIAVSTTRSGNGTTAQLTSITNSNIGAAGSNCQLTLSGQYEIF